LPAECLGQFRYRDSLAHHLFAPPTVPHQNPGLPLQQSLHLLAAPAQVSHHLHQSDQGTSGNQATDEGFVVSNHRVLNCLAQNQKYQQIERSKFPDVFFPTNLRSRNKNRYTTTARNMCSPTPIDMSNITELHFFAVIRLITRSHLVVCSTGANRLAPRGLRAAATGVAAGWDRGPAVIPLASGCDLPVECRGLAAGRVGLRVRFG
jgi:hypothetical protein